MMHSLLPNYDFLSGFPAPVPGPQPQAMPVCRLPAAPFVLPPPSAPVPISAGRKLLSDSQVCELLDLDLSVFSSPPGEVMSPSVMGMESPAGSPASDYDFVPSPPAAAAGFSVPPSPVAFLPPPPSVATTLTQPFQAVSAATDLLPQQLSTTFAKGPARAPNKPAPPTHDDEDDELARAAAAAAEATLVTTRSGRRVRQVRYTEPGAEGEAGEDSVLEGDGRRRSSHLGRSRRRCSGAHSPGAPFFDRRDLHNVSERQRRAELKNMIDDLRLLVPEVADDPKVHTGDILQAVIRHIRSLEREDKELQEALEEERARNRHLLNTVPPKLF